MSRHYEKTVQRARDVQESVGRAPDRTEPRTREEIESFVKGFGMSARATRRVVEEWYADSQRSRDAGWEAHADATYYDER